MCACAHQHLHLCVCTSLCAQVTRRLSAEEEVKKMKVLLARTEHEWLAYRADVEELRAGREQVRCCVFLDVLSSANACVNVYQAGV